MSFSLIIQLVVLLGAIAAGARAGGVGMGLWGGVGLVILVFLFNAVPGSISGEVLLIILAVIMAASAMEAAGGIEYHPMGRFKPKAPATNVAGAFAVLSDGEFVSRRRRSS